MGMTVRDPHVTVIPAVIQTELMLQDFYRKTGREHIRIYRYSDGKSGHFGESESPYFGITLLKDVRSTSITDDHEQKVQVTIGCLSPYGVDGLAQEVFEHVVKTPKFAPATMIYDIVPWQGMLRRRFEMWVNSRTY